MRSFTCLMASLAVHGAPALAVEGSVKVTVDWAAKPFKVVETAATIEVDCCEPFLTRDPQAHLNGGGPFVSYMESMKALGADFVRWAPWYPYPRVVVMELEPSDCTVTKPATNWNSSAYEAVTADFLQVVCGPESAAGKDCEHSVAIQLATAPSWMYVNGADPNTLPKNPWVYPDGNMGVYNQGTTLKDESCGDMAAYFSRVVAHFTAGGHNDTCGHWHPSGFHYKWDIVSILNENEHNTGGPRYTRCFDAIREEIEKVNPTTAVEGPETALSARSVWGEGDYTNYFIDPGNHKGNRAPAINSNHFASFANGGSDGSGYAAFFDDADTFLARFVEPLVAERDAKAPDTKLVINEWIPFVDEWCDPDDAARVLAVHGGALGTDPRSPHAGCPQWDTHLANGSAVGINRKTLGWSASAAQFAYGYAALARRGYYYVGQDDLACGPWPDNEPAVTGMDWQTGQPNAKFFVTQMLAEGLGSGPKALINATVTGFPPPPTPPPPALGTKATGYCAPTSSLGDCSAVNSSTAKGTWAMDRWPDKSLEACAAKAKAACQSACYVSFSAPHNDCSWYSACNMANLHTSSAGANYTTELIRTGGPPPPPPPPLPPPAIDALPYILDGGKGKRGLLLVNRKHYAVTAVLEGLGDGMPTAMVLEGTGDEPGFLPPFEKVVGADGSISIGPYGVALFQQI